MIWHAAMNKVILFSGNGGSGSICQQERRKGCLHIKQTNTVAHMAYYTKNKGIFNIIFNFLL